jgi:hypothetical protein
MAKVLSIDLAYKRVRDFGICVLESRKGNSLNAVFVPPCEIIHDPPDAGQCADAISNFCEKQKIRVVLLDGPQGWKDPESPLPHSRQCERVLFTQGKTGTVGFAKPAPFTPFAEFSIRLFAELIRLGGQLVSDAVPKAPKDGLLIVESYPTSAWRKLGIKPLPGKAAANLIDIRDRLLKLQALLRLQVEREPTHDQLQALVAGIAGIALLAGNPSGCCVQGSRPKEVGGVRLEGFIVNPCIEGLAPFAARKLPTACF